MNDKDCKSFEELLVLQVYGELEECDKEPLADHLAQCSACRERNDELIQVSNEYAELEAPLPEPVFVNECIEGLLEKRVRSKAARTTVSQQRPFILWPAFSVATFLLLFVAYQAFIERPPRQSRENWLTVSRAPQRTVPSLTKSAAPPVLKPIDKVRRPKESLGPTDFPALVTAMVPLPKGQKYDSHLRWNDGLKAKLVKLSSRLAAINNRHPGREYVTKYGNISKRLSRLNNAIERL